MSFSNGSGQPASAAAAVIQAATSSTDNVANEEGRTRKTSTSNRFEIKKVEDSPSNLPKIPTIDGMNESGDELAASTSAAAAAINQSKLEASIRSVLNDSTAETTAYPNSVLKKKTTHYKYDDDYFDFDSHQNTATKREKSRLLIPFQSKLNEQKELLEKQRQIKEDDDDEDENDDGKNGCFQINYDSKNRAKSVTCNLQAAGLTSYGTCFHDCKTIALYQKLIAEFLGTMILTLYACSIGLPITEKGVPSINGCLGGGITLATLIWILGSVSGGHFNPSVTIAFLFTGKINPLITMLYIGAQLVGALTGAYILFGLSPDFARGKLSVTEVHQDITLGQAYAVELIITFILVLTIFSCVDSRRNDLTGSFPLQIGLAVAVGGLFGGRFTGGSMNPARSFGPAVVMGLWQNHWIYW